MVRLSSNLVILSEKQKLDLEPVSKPSEYNHQACDLGKSVKEERVKLISGYESSKLLDPGDRTFDFPSTFESSQWSAVLSCWPNTSFSVRTDELDVSLGQRVSKFVAVSGSIVNEFVGNELGSCAINQAFHQVDFGPIRRVYIDGNG